MSDEVEGVVLSDDRSRVILHPAHRIFDHGFEHRVDLVAEPFRGSINDIELKFRKSLDQTQLAQIFGSIRQTFLYQSGLPVAGRAGQERLAGGPEEVVGAELVGAWIWRIRIQSSRRHAEVLARGISAEVRLKTFESLRDNVAQMALGFLC